MHQLEALLPPHHDGTAHPWHVWQPQLLLPALHTLGELHIMLHCVHHSLCYDPPAPTPIGLIPGHLSSVIKQQATRGARPLGSTVCLHSFLATAARAWHRLFEPLPRAVHILFQAYESRLEGPADPLHWQAMFFLLQHLWCRIGPRKQGEHLQGNHGSELQAPPFMLEDVVASIDQAR